MPLHPCARCAASRTTCCQRAEIVVTTGDVARIASHTGHDAVPRPSGLGPMVVPNDPASPKHDLAQSSKVVARDTTSCREVADLGAFWHRTRPTDPDYFDPDPDDPNWVRYTIAPDGTRRVLRKQDGRTPGLSNHRGPAGDCTFLGPMGCVLPEDVRPLVCRLYPFAYTERGLDAEGTPPEEPAHGPPPPTQTGLDESYCPTGMFFDSDRRALPASNLPPGTPRTTMLTVLGMDPRDAERWRAMLYAELRADAGED